MFAQSNGFVKDSPHTGPSAPANTISLTDHFTDLTDPPLADPPRCSLWCQARALLLRLGELVLAIGEDEG